MVLLSCFLSLENVETWNKDDLGVSNDQYAIRLAIQWQGDRKSQGSNSARMVFVCVHVCISLYVYVCVSKYY